MADLGRLEDHGWQNKGKLAKELNDTIRYTMWSVFRLERVLGDADRDAEAAEVDALVRASSPPKDVVVRGTYDVSGLRADADLMIWWHAPTVGRAAGAPTTRSAAPRSAAHGAGLVADGAAPAGRVQQEPHPGVPGRRGDPALRLRLPVRALVRVVPAARRGAPRHAAEHGKMARDYPDVRANTVASFALGDYEWILAFEADELHRIVDLMRDLRAAAARRHVREEVPFYTGRAHTVAELTSLWP